MVTLGAFPTESVMFDIYSKLFNTGKAVVVGFIPGLMMARALLNMFTSRGSSEQGKVITDTLITVVLMVSFMIFLKITLDLPNQISGLFPNSGTYSMKFGDPDKDAWNDFFNYATILCFWIAAVIYMLILIVLSAAGAYLICFGAMTGAYWVPKMLFWAVTLVSCWPLLWYALNMAIHALAIDDGFVNALVATIINIVKALSPMVAAMLALRNPMASAVKSTATGAAKLGATVVGGAANLGATALSKTGGQPILNKINSTTSAAKSSFNAGLAKTLPTLANGIVKAGKGSANFASHVSPNTLVNGTRLAKAGLKGVANHFANQRDPHSGEIMSWTSPAAASVRSATSTLHGKVAKTKAGLATAKVADMFNAPKPLSKFNQSSQPTAPNGSIFMSKEEIKDLQALDPKQKKRDSKSFAKEMYLDFEKTSVRKQQQKKFDWNNL